MSRFAHSVLVYPGHSTLLWVETNSLRMFVQMCPLYRDDYQLLGVDEKGRTLTLVGGGV